MFLEKALFLVGIFDTFYCTQAHNVGNKRNDPYDCGGLEPEECKKVTECVKDIKILSAANKNKRLSREKLENTVRHGDVILNYDQCDVIRSRLLQRELDILREVHPQEKDDQAHSHKADDQTHAREIDDQAYSKEIDDQAHVNGKDDPALCEGMEHDECKKVIECVKDIQMPYSTKGDKKLSRAQLEDTVILDDVILNINQCKRLRDRLVRKHLNFPELRKIIDFKDDPDRKWDFPIPYMINTDQIPDVSDHESIRFAFNHWEERTCITFTEIPYSKTYKENHIEVYNNGGGCYSSLGKQDYKKQYISLGPNCLKTIGKAIHEIGHSLGLVHEQSRPDRDDYVNILYENVEKGKDRQFQIDPSTTTMGLPYDYSSIMHYGSVYYSFDKKSHTIETKDPDFQYNIGNRARATFMDVTALNRAYGCLDPISENFPSACHNPEATCKNGGYPNPKENCKVCVCPDGLGKDCTTAADGSNGCSPISGDIEVSSTMEECLISPKYNQRRGKYQAGDHCSWLLKAPAGRKIKLYFDLTDGFGVTAAEDACQHWVEIKYKGNITETGPRFCGSFIQDLNQHSVITSEDDAVLVDFRSDLVTQSTSQQRGFKLCYSLI